MGKDGDIESNWEWFSWLIGEVVLGWDGIFL